MILIDYRAGSGSSQNAKRPPLADYIEPKSIVQIGDYDADVSFVGDGPEGPVIIAMEYKKIDDVLRCIADGRMTGEQLPKMIEAYGSAGECRMYLLIEGAYRVDTLSGILETRVWDPRLKRFTWKAAQSGREAWLYRQLDNWLTTLEEKVEHDFGVRLTTWRTWGVEESAAWVKDKFIWWTAKPFAAHRSHLKWASKDARLRAAKAGRNILSATRTRDLPVVQRIAAELYPTGERSTIGPERSVEVARHFKTPLEMFMADEREWQKIKGIGRQGAARIIRTIEEGDCKPNGTSSR